MKLYISAAGLLAGLLVSPFSFAHFFDRSGPLPNPAGHAPAGVMSEHMHNRGGAMLGYRFVQSRHSGLRHGSEAADEAALIAAGYSAMPESMTMRMHMLDLMYAPSDWLNLMLMPQWMSMDMSMSMSTVADGHGHGEHDHGGGHNQHSGHHDHGVSGLGDTIASALVRLYQHQGHLLHLGLGLSIPTGSVSEVGEDGRFLHYGMQLGSGTWDALPTLTYNGFAGPVSWGFQLGATQRLQSENDSGFRFGNRQEVSLWSAYRALEWVSLSVRMQYRREGGLRGHYNASHNHSSPGDVQANYGGETWQAGVGANLVAPSGPFAHQRLGFEWLVPVSEHYRGYQLGLDSTLAVSWSTAF